MNRISVNEYGMTKDGQQVWEYVLENKNQAKAHILSYAGIIRKLLVPDVKGTLTDVVVGYDALADYEADTQSIGAFVGRYAGRIKNASFTIGESTYQLPQNEGANHLHGVLNHKNFQGEIADNKLILSLVSPDGEDGFPGDLSVKVSYELTDKNELVIGYEATSTKDTVLNLTNHSYFNLNGQDGSEVCNHLVKVYASQGTATDEGNVCNGDYFALAGTDLDFGEEKDLSLLHTTKDPRVLATKGVDHNFVIDSPALSGCLLTEKPMRMAASVYSPKTGIRMNCMTTQPGVQIYTANYLGIPSGKAGIPYPEYGAICLETQHYPNSPNIDHFPTALLKAGESFEEWTVFQFMNA